MAHIHEKLQKGIALRVLFVNDIGFDHGAGIAHWRQVQSFLLMGHDVMALCWQTTNTNRAEMLHTLPGRWHGLQQMPHLHSQQGYGAIEIATGLKQMAMNFQPDVIIVGNLHSAGWSVSILVALRQIAPTVAYMHDCHYATGRCAYPETCTRYRTGCNYQCPTPNEYPALVPEKIAPEWQLRQEVFSKSSAIAVAANSQWTLDIFKKSVKNTFFTGFVAFGLDTNRFRPIEKSIARRLLNLPQSQFIVAFGSINTSERRKGGHLIQGVVHALQDEVQFISYGNGDKMATDGVLQLGFIDDLNYLPLIYSAADVYLGAPLSEAFGQVYMEAAACGTPIVAPRVGGIDTIARHGINARLVEHGTVDELIKAIQFFMNNDAATKQYGAAGRQLVLKEFNLHQQGENWHKFLMDMPLTSTVLQHRTSIPEIITRHSQRDYPRISIVTPSYNQAAYLQDTIRSIVEQGYPNLEYVIIDGGSTDGSVDIIKQYADKLTYWVSEPDTGQADALNKGFARTSGDIMMWLNADDILLAGSLFTVANIFSKYPEIQWLTAPGVTVDFRGNVTEAHTINGWNRNIFLTQNNSYLSQENTAWSRSLWEQAGGYIVEQYVACDYELWARFFRYAKIYHTRLRIGAFRIQPLQISRKRLEQYKRDMLAIQQRELTITPSVNMRAVIDSSQFTEVVYNLSTMMYNKHDIRYITDGHALVELFHAADQNADRNLNISPLITTGRQLRVKTVKVPNWGQEIHPVKMLQYLLQAIDEDGAITIAWLGAGTENGLHLTLEASDDCSVHLTMWVKPGPARRDSQRALTVTHAEANNAGQTITFNTNQELAFRLNLHKGDNPISIIVPEEMQPDTDSNPTDERPLLVLVYHIEIQRIPTHFQQPLSENGAAASVAHHLKQPASVSYRLHYYGDTQPDATFKPTWTGYANFINAEHQHIFELTEHIPGWQVPQDSQKLYEMAYFAGERILEIGTYYGRSATVMLRGAVANNQRSAPHYVGVDIDPHAIERTRETLSKEKLADYVTLFQGTLADYIKNPISQPTMVFIDGDHTYSGVKKDLEALSTFLKPGIPILCHDYTYANNEDSSGLVGVNQAVDEWVAARQATFAGVFGCSILLIKNNSLGEPHALDYAPVVLYHPATLASNAIWQALVQTGLREQDELYHVHSFADVDENALDTAVVQSSHTVGARKLLPHVQAKRSVRVITIIEEPISRNLSLFFEHYNHYQPDVIGFGNLADNMQTFIETFNHEAALAWFDIELKTQLGIDIYQYPFPREHGVLRLTVGHVDLLVLKLEIGTAAMEDALRQFLNLPQFTVHMHNTGTDKAWADAYATMKREAVLPMHLVNQILDSKHTRHFYTEVEREILREQWLQRIIDAEKSR